MIQKLVAFALRMPFIVLSTATVLVLAGRYLEARAKRRAGAALRALLEMGAKRNALIWRFPVRQHSGGEPENRASFD